MLSWNDVVEVSREEARQTFLDMLDGIGFAATSWQEGSIPLALVEVAADFWSRGTKIAVAVKGFGLNDTAQGEALRRFSLSHYQNTKLAAVAAQRLVTLECEAGEGPHTIDVNDVVITDAAGKLWRNVEDPDGNSPASYPATIPSGGTLQIIVEADEPGAHNPEAGGVSILVSTYAGVTVVDDQILRRGTDEERDERLRERNALKWSLLTRFGSIDEAAVALALGASEGVSRVAVHSRAPRGDGTFDVYITGDTGAAGTEDLEAVQAAIEPYLMGQLDTSDPDDIHHVLSGGQRVLLVQNAPLLPLDIEGTIYLSAEHDWDDVRPLLIEHLEAWRRTIPLGGFPYPSPGNRVSLNEIEHQIRRFELGGQRPIRTVVLTTPSSDVAVPAFGHVTQGNWTGSWPGMNITRV